MDGNNRDVLNIFLELVFHFEGSSQEYLEDIIVKQYHKLNKYIDLLFDFKYNKPKEVTQEEYETCSKYIVSILKALNLFRKYQDNPTFRKDILKGIQHVFDEKVALDDLLKIYEVSETKEIQFLMRL